MEQGSNSEQAVLQSLGMLIRQVEGLKKEILEIGEIVRGGYIEKEWYSTSELAKLVEKSDYTIREKWCNQRRIECEKDPATGKWRIPGSEVRRLQNGGSLNPR